ncbi:hypothetical protein ABFX02_02G162400 [Erythranthe guttata]
MERHRTKAKSQSTFVFFLATLITIAFFTQWLDISIITGSLQRTFLSQTYSEEFDCSINCSQTSQPITTNAVINPSKQTCPEYFRWIHEDLRAWRDTGITKEMVEKAKNVAHIRIIIVNGRLYTQKYKDVYQTRDVVTVWGLLQLLRLYPGRLPDLDLMLECADKPVIKKRNYVGPDSSVPPLFHYCGDDSSYDIVFPDWSFWGWPEVNIKPWEELKEDIKEGSRRIEWKDKEPYAYWKGNAKLGAARRELLKCNISDRKDTKARIFAMEWKEEKKQNFRNTDLASQCNYRYKIYVEGVSWSVSQKYILACDSMALVIKPRYYDFFTRSLLPSIHYWPIDEKNMCKSIEYAVEWGNKYTDKAEEIGKYGSKFVQENLAMEYIYDYAFHLLNEYAKLLKYKPKVPQGAVETCSENLICSVKGQKRRFRKHSMVKNPSDSLPCDLPPAYDFAALRALFERKESLENRVFQRDF